MSETGTPRHAPPFYCPYCGEEDIRPWGEAAAQYRCSDCLRVWILRMVGTTTTEAGSPDGPTTEATNGAR